MNDVIEFLVDGTSGIAPGDVSGKAMVVGVCSKGEVGKSYLLGKSSDLSGLLGTGPLVDRLRDIFATGGQEAIVVAVPCEGIEGKYISSPEHTGTGAGMSVSGVPGVNADVVVKVESSGALGTATVKVSMDKGVNYGSALQAPADGKMSVAGLTGITLIFDGDLVKDDEYKFVARMSIGSVDHVGTGAEISVSGAVKCAADIIFQITKAGGRNEGTYQLSTDGDSFGIETTIPADGKIIASDTGVEIVFPDDDAVLGDTYSFRLLPPHPSISTVMSALERPLQTLDVENIYIVGATNSIDWASVGAKADELFNKHRPTYFICETRLPYADETIDEWTTAMLDDRAGYAHRFVSVCATFGEVADSTGKRQLRNAAGLLQGRILSVPVQRSVGRVRDASISQLTLPAGWTEGHVSMLSEAGFIVAKHYAGLNGVYWEDAKTMADKTSDYQYVRVLRTVFKGLRLARIAALGSMYDEAGDPVRPEGAAGLTFMKAKIENAVKSMKKAQPSELADCIATIPSGQDIVNNGVAVELDFIGIPVIGKIKLFARYINAGSGFDPRLEVK